MLPRRLIAISVMLALSAALANTAHAEKDPFQPLVREGDPAETTASTGAAATPVTAGGTAQTLPQTGFDFVSPALLALLFLMGGVVLLSLVRYAEAPLPTKHRAITQDIS